LINRGTVDRNFEKFFVKRLNNLFERTEDKELKTVGQKFLSDINKLMQRLFDLKSMPEDPQYEDEKAFGIVNLMENLKKTERQHLYTKYCHALTSYHLKLENFVEAGNSMLLHVKALEWTLKPLPEDEICKLPAQLERERKIQLMKMSISLFDKAKYWEEAITVLDVLAGQYKTFDFDYVQLAENLQQQSTMYSNITSIQRVYHEYFRVAFYGRGFGELQNKEFVYKGNILERLEEFSTRIKRRFSNAEMLNYTDLPPPDILNSEKQYLQVFPIKPASQEELEGKERKLSDKMPIEAQKYVTINDTDVFVYPRVFRKNKKKGETLAEEVKDLWIKKTFYVTTKKFPHIQRRSLIKETKEAIMDPIDNAISSMLSKTKEIYEMIDKYDKEKEKIENNETITLNINPFTMLLQGVINAAVNGGSELYRQVFLIQEFINSNPNKKPQILKLKENFLEQLEALETGMKLHNKLITDKIRELHNSLEGLLLQCKKGLHEHFTKLLL